MKSYSFQNGYGYVQEAKISAREAQLPIRSEKHLKLKFWQTSRFLNVFSDFPLVQATLDIDVARCECDINIVVGAVRPQKWGGVRGPTSKMKGGVRGPTSKTGRVRGQSFFWTPPPARSDRALPAGSVSRNAVNREMNCSEKQASCNLFCF